MALEPQKASTNKENAASEENHKTTAHETEVASGEQESAETQTKTELTAQTQHDTRPEVENQPQGLNETQAPAEPEAEVAVRERKKSNEYTLSCSDEAFAHMAGTSTDDMVLLIAKAYVRIYRAEAVLCGAIEVIPIGRVPALLPHERWWSPFDVNGRWFKLRYHDTYIRIYEIIPSPAPTPSDDNEPPPPQNRRQRRAPPQRVGPRPRQRPNRDDPQGSRAVAPQPQAKAAGKKRGNGKKKGNESKRIGAIISNFVRAEVEAFCGEVDHTSSQLWRQLKPKMLRRVVRMRRFSASMANVSRDCFATVVQVPRRIAAVLAKSVNLAFTGAGEVAPETFGPSGRLEASDAGHAVGLRVLFYSWRWDEPPIPWAEYIFGVDWSLNIFGVREEEQAFT